MSMAMPPDYAPGLPTPPGGGDPMMGGNAPPQDALNGQPLPSGGGIDGLMAALGGGGGADPGLPPGAGPGMDDPGGTEPPGPDSASADMDSIGHIQEAMKHLLMAMAMDSQDQHGQGITKGMGALQGILSGEQKRQQQMSQLQGPGPAGGAGPTGG